MLLESGSPELAEQIEQRLSGVPAEIGRTWRHLGRGEKER